MQLPNPDIVGQVVPDPELLPTEERHRISKELRAMPWREDNPGHLHRGPVVHNGVAFYATVRCCADCGETWPAGYMLDNRVWAKIACKDTVLCYTCAESRLGRRITAADLPTNASLNRIFLHLLGSRE